MNPLPSGPEAINLDSEFIKISRRGQKWLVSVNPFPLKQCDPAAPGWNIVMENSTALASTHEDGKGETARLHYHSFEAWREKHWQHYQERSVHKVISHQYLPHPATGGGRQRGESEQNSKTGKKTCRKRRVGGMQSDVLQNCLKQWNSFRSTIIFWFNVHCMEQERLCEANGRARQPGLQTVKSGSWWILQCVPHFPELYACIWRGLWPNDNIMQAWQQ